MPTKITFVYDNPASPDAFEAGFEEQLTLAARVPGVERIESSKVWPKEDGSPTPLHRLLDLYFSDYEAASRAVATEAAGALLADVFERSGEAVRIVFAEVQEVPAESTASQPVG